MDLFDWLPIDVFHKILSSITTSSTEEQPTLRSNESLSRRFPDTNEAVRTSTLSKTFLQVTSTLPVLNLSCKVRDKEQGGKEASKATRLRFAKYLKRTLTRYQRHNIPLQTLRLTVVVENVRFANYLDQLFRKYDDEYHVINEIYLTLLYIPYSNLLQSIFSFKKLVSLTLVGCDLLNNDFEFLVSCSNLRTLELYDLPLDQCLLEKLFSSCPLIEGLLLVYCETEAIKVANLPNLKWLEVITINNQSVDVNAPSLELFKYEESRRTSSYLPSIQSTQNLKALSLQNSTLTDGQFHNLIATCPVLEQLILDSCFALENIKVSSRSLTFLRLKSCIQLMVVTIDAPHLSEFELIANKIPSSLAFTSSNSRTTKSSVTLSLYSLIHEQKFLKLSEFLKAFKRSDDISLAIYSDNISFDKDTFNVLKDDAGIIPEFEQVYILVCSPLLSVYSSFMEGLLATFSPKFLAMTDATHDFVEYLCKELSLAEDDSPNISTRPSHSWRSYFKQVKFEDIDEKWRPLQSWESMGDVLNNLGNLYSVKLSHL